MPNASAKIGDVTQIYFDEKAISFNYHTILLAADIAVSRKATISEGHSLISSLCTANRYAISFFLFLFLSMLSSSQDWDKASSQPSHFCFMTLKKSVTTIPFHTCSQIIMFKNMPLYYTRQNLVGCVRVCIFTSAKNCISTYFVFNYRHDEIKLTLSLCWRTVSKRL